MESQSFIHYALLVLLTSLPVIPFTTEETTGCTNEVAKVAKKPPRNLPSCLFHILLFQ